MSNQGTSQLEDEVDQLPGFRFHPTDEELVAFYLRRKVDKKTISMELIKQIDIYKHDPWDLPKASGSTVKDTEWYFFCRRGRKYRNSIRPNRVTGSGFWKATGIDKPVYSMGGEGRDCIGLKKTLVYYRGTAGKGSKTDWMMHEFRLPAPSDTNTNTNTKLDNAKSAAQEAEIWTLCRIFKRNLSHRKYTPDWRELSTKRHHAGTSSKACSGESSNNRESYINFGAPFIFQNENNNEIKTVNHINNESDQLHVGQLSSSIAQPPSSSFIAQPPSSSSTTKLPSSFSSFPINPVPEANEFFAYENWDELRSVVEFAYDPSLM
ncbi:hypothetical protein RGQ29_018325 [Quercus rubra]|uniref:NAC domain-containing protein n=1 Tax=Quercus rubra TaxID=3512 RepID=A0AAN7J1Z7_QUERU|nr:hypothetical protein RGQ29_018325 [Quercus rubra]